MNMRGKKDLLKQRLLKSENKLGKENWKLAYFKEKILINNICKKKKIAKIHNNVWNFSPNFNLIISKKCVVIPNFLFGF